MSTYSKESRTFWPIIPKIAVIFGITLVYIKKKQYLCALNC